MSDTLSEPAFIPEWFKRGGSSAAAGFGSQGLRGDGSADQNKQRSKLLGPEPPRSSAPDGWQPRGSANGGLYNARPPEHGGGALQPQPQRPTAAGPDRHPSVERSWKQRDSAPASNGSGGVRFAPAAKAPADAAGAKPFGGGASSSRAFYGSRHEPEGGAAAPGRVVDRDPWPPARQGGRDSGDSGWAHEDVRPVAAAAGPPAAKSAFDKDFPSLHPKAAAPVVVTPPPAPSSTTVAPYKQEFLSARANSNWTSKLAEAPQPTSPPPPQPPPPAPVEEPPAATAPPVVAPMVSLRPSGVWGSGQAAGPPGAAGAPSSIAEALLAANGAAANGSAREVAGANSKARLEQLAVKQSKQLIPVISATSSKNRSMGGAKLVTSNGTASSPFTSAPAGAKPGAPAATAGVLKLQGSRKDEAGGTASAASSNGPLVLSGSSTVTLSKKLSQPLDRPLASVPRTVSASAVPGSAPASSLPPVAEGSRGGAPAPRGAGLDLLYANGADAVATATQQQQAPQVQRDKPAAAAEAQAHLQQQQQQQQQQQPAAPKFCVPAEEEAFLRSLGWTEGDDDEEEEPLLTEEEIAAFKAKLAAAGRPPLGAAAGAAQPKPVPAAARRPTRPLIVAASYGSHLSTTDSDSECE